MTLSRRACLAVLASAVASRVLRGQEAPPPAIGPTSRPTSAPAPRQATLTAARAAEVRTVCDGLIGSAVRSGFGWGWTDDDPAAPADPAPAPPAKPKPGAAKLQPVDAALTARVGLFLLRAGQLLKDPPFMAAAVQAGRGAMALQTRTGQVRGRGVMGAFGGMLDDPSDVPDRQPTRLALALVLMLLDAAEAAGVDPDPRLLPPAKLAAHWVAGQQARTGGWPTLHPPGAERGKGTRLLKLTDPDFRDTALVVRLAADVLDDRQLDGRLARVADLLGDVRVWAGRPQRRALWCGAYKLDGDYNIKLPDLPAPSVDLLATRLACEVLIAGVLAGGKPTDPAAVVLQEARAAIAGLARTPEGDWFRRYDFAALRPIGQSVATTRPESPFAPFPPAAGVRPDGGPSTPPPPDPPQRTVELLSTLDRLGRFGPGPVAELMSAVAPIRLRIALIVGQVAPDALLADGDPELPEDAGGLGGGATQTAVREGWKAMGRVAVIG